MALSALQKPDTDPTLIFDHFRNGYATELLTVACADFDLFSRLRRGGKDFESLRLELDLAPRAANVLFTALRAMNLIRLDSEGRYDLTPESREHLVPGEYFEVGGYVGLVAEAPNVRALAQRLKTNKPADNRKDDDGAAFIFREGMSSAMDREASARRLTMALAGRARNVAPYLAANLDLFGVSHLLDVGGGTGIYSIACLQKNPSLKATVWDRPEVLKVAREMSEDYGVADRLECLPGDMLADAIPGNPEAILLSNILHDWDLPECRQLVAKCYDALPAGGRLLIHDVFLNDDLGGPLPIALYSTALFSLTEGRAYSAAEYRNWLAEAGFQSSSTIVPTQVHCGVLEGRKPG